MDRVFIHWDNSNIFHEAQRLAQELEEGPGARYRVRIHFENMLRLAHADRPVQKALAAGSVPPEMRQRMHKRGWRVEILSWAHATNPRMRRWAEANGIFVSLDDFYDAITFMVPSRPGFELAPARDQAPLDLSRRRAF